MKIKFSCVIDQQPKFARQALTWAASLLTYGAQQADALVIHSVGDCDSAYQQIFEAWGIATPRVARFDARHGPSNKLMQLESELLHSADYVVLCDCDIAFCNNIAPWITGPSVRACIAALKGLSAESWAELFRAAQLTLPVARMKAMLVNAETLSTYCNGGLLLIPQAIFQQLRSVWPKWNRWLLERPQLIERYFTDQISFALACEELQLSIDHLPLELNFHTDLRYGDRLKAVTGKSEVEPLVLHYHQLTKEGFLLPTYMDTVNRQIEKINDLIRWLKQTECKYPPASFLNGLHEGAQHETQPAG